MPCRQPGNNPATSFQSKPASHPPLKTCETAPRRQTQRVKEPGAHLQYHRVASSRPRSSTPSRCFRHRTRPPVGRRGRDRRGRPRPAWDRSPDSTKPCFFIVLSIRIDTSCRGQIDDAGKNMTDGKYRCVILLRRAVRMCVRPRCTVLSHRYCQYCIYSETRVCNTLRAGRAWIHRQNRNPLVILDGM